MKLYKNAWFDLAVAILAIALGVVMLPVFGIVEIFVNILLALALTAYLILFLLDKLRHTRGTVFAMTAVEFALLSAAVLTLVVQQFIPESVASVCQVLGVVLWLRGFVMTATLYISALSSRKPRRNMPLLLVAMLMITAGVWLFVSPIFSDVVCEWIICIALFITGLIFAALSFLFYHPKKKEEK